MNAKTNPSKKTNEKTPQDGAEPTAAQLDFSVNAMELAGQAERKPFDRFEAGNMAAAVLCGACGERKLSNTYGLVCVDCEHLLDLGVRHWLPQTIKRRDDERLARHVNAAAAEVCEQVVAQLRAVLQGRSEDGGVIGSSSHPEADKLTRECTAFDTFLELVEAPGYWPKLECSRSWCDDKVQRAKNQRLADLYDREQAARGDSRRVTRLGVCGI